MRERKDSKGRILKKGEAQRPNGTYMFRYTDKFKKKHWCYAPTLQELRKKEEIINGINYSEGEMSVLSFAEQYVEQLFFMRLREEGYPYSSLVNRDAIKLAAREAGESLNAFINKLINAELERYCGIEFVDSECVEDPDDEIDFDKFYEKVFGEPLDRNWR